MKPTGYALRFFFKGTYGFPLQGVGKSEVRGGRGRGENCKGKRGRGGEEETQEEQETEK